MSTRRRHFGHSTSKTVMVGGFLLPIFRIGAAILCAVLVFVPTVPAFASETPESQEIAAVTPEQSVSREDMEASSDTPPVPEEVVDADVSAIDDQIIEDEVETEVKSDPEELTEVTIVTNETAAASAEDVAELVPEQVTEEVVMSDTSGSTEIESVDSEGSSGTDATNTVPAGEYASTSDTSESAETELDPEALTPVEEMVEDDLSTTTVDEILEIENDEGLADETDHATTGDEVVSVSEEAQMVVAGPNMISFLPTECATTGDGGYYCTKTELVKTVAVTDGVFAGPDADGDMEVFIRNGEDVEQITNNRVDDSAPFYDPSSESVVWHRLIEGRYQIMVYDLENAVETQITHDHYNNMEPSRYGDIILWQGWVGDDWDILMSDGGEITMLTDNTTPDVAPYMNGDYALWQSFDGGTWKVSVYDQRTKKVEVVGDTDGGSIQNPRFVLVYDTEFENGDVETRGYDLKSGEVVPLAATPAPVPTEIPEPDQTGEERALIQNKSSNEDEDLTHLDEDTTSDPPETPNMPVMSEIGTTTDMTLVIPPLIVDATTTMSELAESVVIPPYTESTSTGAVLGSFSHIEDLIIPQAVPEE